ncbi:Gfo/Idh/MocA family oxidoreductase [Microlunatus panaciterrae]|uniref:Dehydrogenase n=1 Tax=Microlunatus panaciterrae TaxID=400768 RepID=A0ABS2RKQ6_9ACTN|nr:Gfo/Idh/MocA family oxidoreductase [Microlunatus panaciterrae]MBM7799072.1 putative dehydrogenase [Microlunatus panaciterrae]
MTIPSTPGSGNDLRVGIIGFGMRAGLWRHAHKPGQGSVVTTVCDTSERGRADAAKALPDARITDSLDDLLASGLDAVLVVTPDHLHAQVAVPALRAGIPVFCEKPLATTIEDCDEVLRVAYETGTRLYVGHNMRHMPVVTQMRDLITSGRIGAVKAIWCRHFVGHGGDFYFKDWHADRRNSTSLLLQKGAHDLDVIHWLAAGYTERVSAMGSLAVYGDVTDRTDRSDQRMTEWYSLDNWPPATQTGLNPVVDVEDISMMTMQLDNGVLASYQQCHFTPDYWRNYTVIGTAGRIENQGDGPGEQIHIWDHRHAGWAEPDEIITIGGDDDGGHGGADPLLIAEFLRFAAEGGATQTSPIAARQAVAAGIKATESLRGNGSALDIPPLEEDLVAYFEAGQPVRTS